MKDNERDTWERWAVRIVCVGGADVANESLTYVGLVDTRGDKRDAEIAALKNAGRKWVRRHPGTKPIEMRVQEINYVGEQGRLL